MKNILSDQRIELACPHCSHKFTERIGKLKTNPKLVCLRCSKTINVDATDMRGQIAKVEKSLLDLERSLGRFGK